MNASTTAINGKSPALRLTIWRHYITRIIEINSGETFGGTRVSFRQGGGSKAFDPAKDEPLTLPQAFDGKPESTLDQFKAAVAQARAGKIAVMTFHGVPDIKHPWVNTEPTKFEGYMEHLKEEGCKVIALRELANYVASQKP